MIALSKGGTLSPSQASSLASGGTVYGVTNTTPWSYSNGGGGGGAGSAVTQTPAVAVAQSRPIVSSPSPVSSLPGAYIGPASGYTMYSNGVRNAIFEPGNSLTYDNFANSSGAERAGLVIGGAAQGIMLFGGGVERVGVGFFEGTVDRAIIWKKANVDEFHNVPDIIRTFEKKGKVVSKGLYEQLNIPGSYLSPGSFDNPGTWYNGQFEFGKIDNQIVHMLFRPY